VTVDATTGKISLEDQATNANDVAAFSSFGNPFVNMASGPNQYALNQLSSGQMLYVTEAAAQGFAMQPFAAPGIVYSYTIF